MERLIVGGWGVVLKEVSHCSFSCIFDIVSNSSLSKLNDYDYGITLRDAIK